MEKRRELLSPYLDPDRADLNEVIDAAREAQSALEDTGAQTQKLRHRVRQLELTVDVLAQMLVESGAVDREELSARVEQLKAKKEEPPPPPPEGMLLCVRCNRNVPARSTVMTGQGAMCDPRCAP